MKLCPKVFLRASKELLRFSCGDASMQFRPDIYLGRDRTVLAIGEAPLRGDVARVICVFESDVVRSEAIELLATLIRHGLRGIVGGVAIGPVTLRIAIDASLGVFTHDEWRIVAKESGVSDIGFDS